MKSKTTAYLLWFFLGLFGGHKFYLNKAGLGILYMFTCGLFFIGWIIDLFTLGREVDKFNANPPPLKQNSVIKHSHEQLPSLENIEDARKKLGLPEGNIYRILYEDFNGNITERNIEILKVHEKNSKKYIYAFCHSALDIRTFRIDRITAMTHDKHRINNIWQYLNHEFTPPPGVENLAALALDDAE